MSDELRARLLKYKGQQMIPELRKQMERALGFPIAEDDFLDLETSDLLRAQFAQKVKRERASHNIKWEPSRATEVWDTLSSIAPQVHDTRVVMFHPRIDYVGAVMVPAGATVQRAREVMESLRYDLCICSLDLTSGLCLEFNHYHDPIERDEFELTTWGQFVPGLSQRSGHKN